MHRKYEGRIASREVSSDLDFFQLTPEVVYTFNIVGYDERNRSSEEQSFSITYKGGELKARQPDVSRSFSWKSLRLTPEP